ncbi:hypothetical protein EDD30_3746 [Couchioplanes caeruleus]|uniref:Uncharacterized protein n=1 Tax=Couchioplanes caeruleus TaxID=56438 RepID=A0A3N1GKS7_9ACTN|nr:hypothetical protein EDD30_3746 [Couchioplanes caeruleus]
MTSRMQQIKAFLAGPRGRRLVTRGRREMAKPQTQRKLRELANRFNRKR